MAYQLRFGNPNVSAPVYDLVYFKQKLPVDLPILPVAQIEPIGGRSRHVSINFISLIRGLSGLR